MQQQYSALPVTTTGTGTRITEEVPSLLSGDSFASSPFPMSVTTQNEQGIQELRRQVRSEEEQREDDHFPFLILLERLLPAIREKVGLEPYWTIDIRVCCPSEMPQSEASIWWHTQMWQARLLMRCDVPDDLAPTLLEHECRELLHHRTADVVERLREVTPDTDLAHYLFDAYLAARNTEIEIEMQQAASGAHRPYHLSGPYEYCNRHTGKTTILSPRKGQRSSLRKVRMVTLPVYECPTGEHYLAELRQMTERKRQQDLAGEFGGEV